MIIDFHTHAFNPAIAQRAIHKLSRISGITPLTGGLTGELIGRMDEWGVDRSVMLSVATKPSQQKIINDWAAETGAKNQRLIPFGSIHPYAENAMEEALRIKELGLFGIKLHPDHQGFMIDDPKLDPLFEFISELELPVVFHAGYDFISPDLVHAPPERTAAMLRRHRRLKAVLAHLGGNARWREVLDLIAGTDGEIYLDTAFTGDCPDELMTKIIRKHGADRILLGSDCPWESAGKMIEKICRLDINDTDKDKILGHNAEKLLFH